VYISDKEMLRLIVQAPRGFGDNYELGGSVMKTWGIEVYPDCFAKEVKKVFDAFICEGYSFNESIQNILKSNLRVQNNSTAVLMLTSLEIQHTNEVKILKQIAMKSLIRELYKAHLLGNFKEKKDELMKFNKYIL
jgi:hypothetical protein